MDAGIPSNLIISTSYSKIRIKIKLMPKCNECGNLLLKIGIILIIVGFVSVIPVQMVLPFPYGLGLAVGLIGLGILGIILAVMGSKKNQKFSRDTLDDISDDVDFTKDKKSWDGI